MASIYLILLLASGGYALKSKQDYRDSRSGLNPTTSHESQSRWGTKSQDEPEDDFFVSANNSHHNGSDSYYESQRKDEEYVMTLNETGSSEEYLDPDDLNITIVAKGKPHTAEHKLYFNTQHGYISPYHDIPLYRHFQDKIFNMVVEIPKGTNASMSMSLGEPMNPIKHEMVNGKPKYVHIPGILPPHTGYIWNYGALPNTWENTNATDNHTGLYGDGRYLNVVEIGKRKAKRGEVIQVKALGAIGFIVNGKIDYKIIAIDVKDPKCNKLHDIWCIEDYFPGRMNATAEWFKHYYGLDGSPNNTLAFGGEWRHREFAHDIVTQSMFRWILLTIAEVENQGISLLNTITGEERKHGKLSFKEAHDVVERQKFPPGMFINSSVH